MMRKGLLLTAAAVVVVAMLRFADGVANRDIAFVRVEGELTDAEQRQVRDAVTDQLARTGASRAADIVAAVEALGWVRLVRARRHWPDVLHVAVIRETLVARWGDDAWLTAGGNVVPAPTNFELLGPARLPAIRAHLSNGPQAMRVFNLVNETAQTIGLAIAHLEEDASGDWTVHLKGGAQVTLGATNLSERFGRFATVYAMRLRDETGGVARVDARYRTGVAVRWLPAPSTAPGGDAPADWPAAELANFGGSGAAADRPRIAARSGG